MIEKIIQKKLDSITQDDITFFAKKQNISLNLKEKEFIYTEIKNNWKNYVSKPKESLARAKDSLEPATYNLLINYYEQYSDLLSHLLNDH